MMSQTPKQSKPIAFYLAVGVAVVCVLAAGGILFRAMTATPAGRSAGGDDFADGVTPELLGDGSGARGLRIQVMDADDPGRVSMELSSETLEPKAAQRYDVTEPRVTVYLQDGRIAHAESRTGTLTMPDRSRPPETGTLTEEVRVRLFEPRADGSSPDFDRDEPVLTWTGESLTFASTLGQVSTNQPFLLEGSTFAFRAKDAIMSINQTLERLEQFTVRQGGELVYFNTGEDTLAQADPDDTNEVEPGTPVRTADGAPARRGAGAGGEEPRPIPALPIETFNQSVMRGGIVLSRAGQQIESDRLDVFARTIDGKLPEDAILRLDTESTAVEDDGAQDAPRPRGGDTPRANAGGRLADAEPPEDTPEAGAQPDAAEPGQTTLVWTGTLTIKPVDAQPAELDSEHLLARFTSQESGVVAFADAATQATGRAAVVEYGFTRALLILSGPSQGRSVQIESPSIGQASMGRFELPLGEGQAAGAVDARVPGPFTVIGADGISRVDSGERARLRFAVRDGRLTGDLLEAEFIGSAKASDRDSWIEADRLLGTFEAGEDGRSALRRLEASKTVRLDDGNGGSGRCEALDARFVLGADEPTPESFIATGGVSFRDPTGRVEGEYLRTEFTLDDGGAAQVARFWAEGAGLLLRRHSDQIDISGRRVFADVAGEYMEVEGGEFDGVTVPARVQRGATVTAGEELVRLNGVERSVLVRGPGWFEHASGSGDLASRVHASWTEGMAFSDVEGELECVGGVNAVHEPDIFTRERIEAELVRVELEPLSELVADAGDDQTMESLGETDREIRTVYAAGGGSLGVGESLATIESARYAEPIRGIELSDGGGQADSEVEPDLERAFRLSGVEILTDNRAGTLRVPGRGRLFIADLREQAEGDDETERGAALFDWTGSMQADRAEGTAEMLGEVAMSHARASDGSRTLLEGARLWVNFLPGAEDSGELFSGLRSAVAETDVYLRTDAREMTADLLQYDPDAGIARALGNAFDGVRILDRATGSPMTASAMIWDLESDRVDVVDPSAITIPRN